MSIPLASLTGAPARPTQPVLGPFTLARGRVHELCGTARHTLTALVMQQTAGPVLWIYPTWQPDRIWCDGLHDFADPGRLILVAARRPEDILWAAEEALRSGVVPVVLAELPQPPALTPVRRLNLAAESGTEAAHRWRGPPPLGLLLTPAEGGAPGVESRWQMNARHDDAGQRWHLTRLRSRTDPPRTWHLEQAARGRIALAPQPAPTSP